MRGHFARTNIKRRKQKSCRLLVALLCVSVALSGCSKKHETAIEPGAVVLAVGDSITAGYGVTRGQA